MATKYNRAVEVEKTHYSPAEIVKMTTLSRSKVYRMIQRGELKAIRIGRRWLVPISEYDKRIADADYKPKGRRRYI